MAFKTLYFIIMVFFNSVLQIHSTTNIPIGVSGDLNVRIFQIELQRQLHFSSINESSSIRVRDFSKILYFVFRILNLINEILLMTYLLEHACYYRVIYYMATIFSGILLLILNIHFDFLIYLFDISYT